MFTRNDDIKSLSNDQISILSTCIQTQTEAKKLRTETEDGKPGHSRGKSAKSEPVSKTDTPAGSGAEDAEDKKPKEEKMDVDEELPEGTDMASVIKRRRAVAARDAKVGILGLAHCVRCMRRGNWLNFD